MRPHLSSKRKLSLPHRAPLHGARSIREVGAALRNSSTFLLLCQPGTPATLARRHWAVFPQHPLGACSAGHRWVFIQPSVRVGFIPTRDSAFASTASGTHWATAADSEVGEIVWNAFRHFTKWMPPSLTWSSGTVLPLAIGLARILLTPKPPPKHASAGHAPAAREVLRPGFVPAGLHEPVKTFIASAVGPWEFLKAEFVEGTHCPSMSRRLLLVIQTSKPFSRGDFTSAISAR